jgi:hypothetical protein
MYYSVKHIAHNRFHCIGAATSDNIMGPYKTLPKPIICPLDIGGAIDPDGFRDADGKRYLVYKVDGNSLNFNHTNDNHFFHPTPLMLQEVAGDGLTFIGEPTQLLDRSIKDGPLIEAPSMARYDNQMINGTLSSVYTLFFSSNVFTGPKYDVSYATSTTGIKGPYTKSSLALLKTGDINGNLFGPGGIDIGVDGASVVFHSGFLGSSAVRAMWTGQIAMNGTRILI